MRILLIAVVGLVVLVYLLFVLRRSKSPVNKTCLICGGTSRFGYSEHAEDSFGKLKAVCLSCLASQLKKDYTSFTGRAVVVGPAEGPPVYVFQPFKEWQEHFEETKIADDVKSLLAEMEDDCAECVDKARYLWVESDGLNGENFGKSLDKGLSNTILQNNPAPKSLCGKCCVKHIVKELDAKQLSYLEVSAPKGSIDGFVIPMGY